ncbi:MAG: hypothetical protein M1815_001256 [Lichina confinis]|nr:MAG: hypothetical protein M1815_001256 [Lichina confinis]
MAIGALFLVASTWLAGTSASYASVNRVNVQLTVGTSPRPGHDELVQLTEGSMDTPLEECPVGQKLETACKDQGSFTDEVYACPSLDGNTRVTPNGALHKLYCFTGTRRGTVKVARADSLVACVDICSEVDGCLGVGWNRKNLECWLKNEYITDTFPTISGENSDSSSEQCPSFDPASDTCPSVSGKIRCDFNEQFRIYCGLALTTTNLEMVMADSLGECMEKCAAIPACKGADYIGGDKRCFIKSSYVDAPYSRKAHVDSFVLVQRRP